MNTMKMKLNNKRTFFVGFAFFLICAFWQAYDALIPKILTDKFGMNQVWSGFIMALDNILAIFLLPLFGSLSDRCKSRLGRRTPFILIGTIAAAVCFMGLSFVDNLQLAKLSEIAAVTETESSAERDAALRNLYSASYDMGHVPSAAQETDTADTQSLANIYGEEDTFVAKVNATDGENTSAWVVQARQAYAWQKTLASPGTLACFIVILMAVLLSMSTFRSPAVALMPDVTPKPLRSKANAIINLMGSAGGILVLILGMVFGTGKSENTLMSYTPFFCMIAGIMLCSLVIFFCTVREVPWAAEAAKINDVLDSQHQAQTTDASGHGHLSFGEKKSLFFLLASVVLWYMGYNAVTSKYSVYAGQVLGLDFNLTMIIAQAAAILSYIPVGIISQKLGRKKTILAGIVFLGIAFGAASFLREGSNIWLMNALFALAGIGWATINVNRYPMVVEMAKSGSVGKYTGFYYTASMAAQIATPILSGAFLTYVGMTTLFPYAAIFVCLAFATMLCVHHGDATAALPDKKDLLEYLSDPED